MRKLCLLVSMCGLFWLWAGPAAAAQIDFEDLPDEPFTSYTWGNRVTFTAVDGGLLQRFADTPNGTFGLTGLDSPYPELRADFVGGTTSVSVYLGDFAGIDAERIFLEIYNASGAKLDETWEDIAANRMGMTKLSLSAPCISYAIFGSRNSTLDNGSSVPADDFVFGDSPCDPTPCIPAPGAILLGVIGMGLVGHLRRGRVL